MTSARRIRVLCVDDHRIVREGLGLIIGQQPDMEVAGLAASNEEGVDLFRQCHPDVTVMDIQMGTVSGVEAIRAIRHEDGNARIVVLTMYVGDEDIRRALDAGAATYLYKDTASDNLVRVIREVDRGQQPAISAELAAQIENWTARPRITPREVQILEFISQGMRDKEIATAMRISEKTVYVHVRNILAKLDVKDRTAAVRASVHRGIIHLV